MTITTPFRISTNSRMLDSAMPDIPNCAAGVKQSTRRYIIQVLRRFLLLYGSIIGIVRILYSVDLYLLHLLKLAREMMMAFVLWGITYR